MKRSVSIILMIVSSLTAFAQDVIVKKDGSTILAKVTKVGEKEIEYKKYKSTSDVLYSILTTEIISINYENGEKDVFDNTSKVSPVQQNKDSEDRMPTFKEIYNLFVESHNLIELTRYKGGISYEKHVTIKENGKITNLQVQYYMVNNHFDQLFMRLYLINKYDTKKARKPIMMWAYSNDTGWRKPYSAKKVKLSEDEITSQKREANFTQYLTFLKELVDSAIGEVDAIATIEQFQNVECYKYQISDEKSADTKIIYFRKDNKELLGYKTISNDQVVLEYVCADYNQFNIYTIPTYISMNMQNNTVLEIRLNNLDFTDSIDDSYFTPDVFKKY